MKGKVKWFNAEKGFGFINTMDNPEKDIFVHYSQIVSAGYKTLTDFQIVEFDLVDTERGLQAINVIVVD